MPALDGEQFVASLLAEMRSLFERLGERETLESESDGRVDIAWYETSAHVDPAGGPQACPNGGPDTVAGPWGLYFTQTLNGHAKTVTFSAPVLASDHPIRRGGIQTIIGNQCGGATNSG